MKLIYNLRGDHAGENRPPAWFWLLPLIVGVVRTLPFLWLQFSNAPDGYAYIKVGYIPKDFLSYLAFIRQAAEDGSSIFINPFTTTPQSPRFVLLFHWVLGLVSRMTGHGNWVLELSRVPLAFLFFGLLWRFLSPLLSERKERLWACVLIAFSGGLELFLKPAFDLAPSTIASAFSQDTWDLVGWSTLASFFNPLWIAALASLLCALGPMLRPSGPNGPKDLLRISGAFAVTYLIHPYTAIFLLAYAAVNPVVELTLQGRISFARYGRIGLALLPPLLGILALSFWQSKDSVYRMSASGIFGPQNVSVFWYPITLGVVGVAAIRGIKLWFEEAHPYRISIISWLVAVVLLHTSPLINGYKFVFLMHMPICILAAPVFARVSRLAWNASPVCKAASCLFFLAAFGQALVLPVISISAARKGHVIPREYERVTAALAAKPAGNVLAPPDLGNILPAFTPQRVWVGQWFLTPNYEEKARFYYSLFQKQEALALLPQLCAQQHIRYLVVPAAQKQAIESQLPGKSVETEIIGNLALLTLEDVR